MAWLCVRLGFLGRDIIGSPVMINHRLSKTRSAMAELGIDALLVSSDHNRRYLSNFTGSAGYLVITVEEALLITDFRYVEQAGNQSPDSQPGLWHLQYCDQTNRWKAWKSLEYFLHSGHHWQ